mgnify:FL=1|nr:MAG TPA: adenine specific DNA methyltransferase [Caudoviricetes sp.]
MTAIKMQAKIIKISDLHLNMGQIKDVPKNPRFIKDERYEALKRSIEDDPEMLQLREIVAYDNNGELVVILGNMRYRAMKELGFKDAPVKVLPTGTSAKKLRAYIQKDNIAFGDNDWDLLTNEWDLEELQNFGLDTSFLDEMEANSESDDEQEAKEDNYDADENTEESTTTQLGDLFKLGNHKLLCGDATKEEYYKYLCGDSLVDLIVTDPPYNVAYKGKCKELKQKSIENDKLKEEDFRMFIKAVYNNFCTYLKKGGAFYIWHADSSGSIFRNELKETGLLTLKQCLIWVKSQIVLGRQDYQWIHEPCLYGWKDGGTHYFTSRRDLSTIIEKLNEIDPEKASKAELQELVKTYKEAIAEEKITTSVIREDKPKRSELHPTMKPVKLIARCIRNSSRKGEIVLDTFGGSGTTLIAAEQLGRKCYMVEFSPNYVDTIIKRWEELTGEKAVKIGNINDSKKSS